MNPIRQHLGLLLLLLLSSCAPTRPSAGPTPESWISTHLYFGLSEPNGAIISDSDFATFVTTQITPAFPDGLTLLSATGQYKNNAGTITKEPTRVLILLYPATNRTSADTKITTLCHTYCIQFHQESVLREDTLTTATFPH